MRGPSRVDGSAPVPRRGETCLARVPSRDRGDVDGRGNLVGEDVEHVLG